MLQTFQLVEYTLFIVQFYSQFARVGEQIRPSREIRDKDAPPVADCFRSDMFVSSRIAFDSRDVNATFVRERTVTDESRARIQREVGNLADEARRLAQSLQPFGAKN